jgi:hypothetical protein
MSVPAAAFSVMLLAWELEEGYSEVRLLGSFAAAAEIVDGALEKAWIADNQLEERSGVHGPVCSFQSLSDLGH